MYLDGNARGQMITTGPGAYKIPGFSDIPKEFNVSLLSGVANQKAVFNSKVMTHNTWSVFKRFLLIT